MTSTSPDPHAQPSAAPYAEPSTAAIPGRLRRHLLPASRGIAAVAVAGLALAGCSTAPVDGEAGATASSSASTVAQAASGTVLDPTQVHTIAIEVDETELAAMIQIYLDSGEKEWITGSVTIDGTTYSDVGLKLKGNSSLRSITTETPAQELPWRIRLDKVVDGQNADGYTDLVIRANSSETSLNEAVALDLLAAAGLASEQSVATRVSVNGSEEVLRLTLQNLDETWLEESFDDDGSGGSVLYKADAEGDYSWRGDDPAAYADAFDVEAGAEDYAPLVELLDLANNASDEDLAAQLPEILDVEEFARYLAFEDLIGNFDDISGPGNNSYLYYDAETEQFTVVAWDHNLAFGLQNVAGGGGGQGGFSPGEGGAMPEGGMPGERPTDLPTDLPDGAPTDLPEGGGFGGGRGEGGAGAMGGAGGMGGMAQENPLVDRFLENATFAALYDEAAADLQSELIDSGLLAEIVEQRASVITDGASDLVDAATIESEAAAIAGYSAEGGSADATAGRVPGGASGVAPSTPPSTEDADAATT